MRGSQALYNGGDPYSITDDDNINTMIDRSAKPFYILKPLASPRSPYVLYSCTCPHYRTRPFVLGLAVLRCAAGDLGA